MNYNLVSKRVKKRRLSRKEQKIVGIRKDYTRHQEYQLYRLAKHHDLLHNCQIHVEIVMAKGNLNNREVLMLMVKIFTYQIIGKGIHTTQ